MAELVTNHVTKRFDGKTVIEDISITVHEKELVCLLGVSGSGKTTLFNVISGLLTPEEGSIYLNGEEITGQSGHISYMLQKDLLCLQRELDLFHEQHSHYLHLLNGEYSKL